MADLRPADSRPVVVREHVPWLWWDRRIATVALPEPEVLAARLAAPRRPVWVQPDLFEAVG